MYRRLLGVLLAALLPVTVLVAAPAHAEGNGYPVIITPTGDVASGFDGPVTIDFSDAPYDDYELEVICDEGYYHFELFWYDGLEGNRTSLDLWDHPIKGPANCQIKVTASETAADATGYFTVAPPPPPPLGFDSATVAPATFYPLVDDNYRDTTTVSYKLNQAAEVDLEVATADGVPVRTLSLGTRVGTQSWTWNGKREDGTDVLPGNYFLTLTATRNDGATATVSRRVTVHTSTVTREAKKYRWGNDGTVTEKYGCSVRRNARYASAVLSCWEGNYAQMRYAFGVPATATNLKFRVNGRLTAGDVPEGRIIRGARRTRPTRLVVKVKVTGWREYEVSKVIVTYTYTARI